MRRLLGLSVLLGIVLLVPATSQANNYSVRTTNALWPETTFPEEVETNYDSFVETASSLAGAPQGGRALQAKNPERFDPPSAFEREQKKNTLKEPHFADAPQIMSGSARHVDKFSKPVELSGAPSYDKSQNYQGYGMRSIDFPTSASNEFNQEKTANRSYEENRSVQKNRRELTPYEKRVILNQTPIF